MAILLLLVGFANAQDPDFGAEEICTEEGVMETCDEGECMSVDVVNADMATPIHVPKKAAVRREATAAPACPDPSAPKPVCPDGAICGDPMILGALDKSLIDTVVKRNMGQIRSCYSRELEKNSKLGGGRMTIKFVVARDGTVSSSTMQCSDLDNSAVEDCMIRHFTRFQFPEPKGGGIVIIKYPLTFSPN